MFSIDEFVFYLRDFIDCVKTEDVVFNDIASLTANFVVSATIHRKFKLVWDSLGI